MNIKEETAVIPIHRTGGGVIQNSIKQKPQKMMNSILSFQILKKR